MAVFRRMKVLWQFSYDLLCHLRNESHQSHRLTYIFMRRAYLYTRGRSRRFLWMLFRMLRPVTHRKTTADIGLIQTLRKDGIALVPQFLSKTQVETMREFLTDQQGYIVGEHFSGAPATHATIAGGLKLQYPSKIVLMAPGMSSLLASKKIRDIAAEYLRCEPIFTGITAWWSFADSEATQSDLDWAGQKFHFDYDWPAFIKFFFYLTDVSEENGPFTYVHGTHEFKHEWNDGRLSDDYVNDIYKSKVKAMTGCAGDMIVADTAGYHKGVQVTGKERLICQIEFAVSRLGASAQYEKLPRSLLPSIEPGHTFDLFSI
jgi:hypothetical protein